MKAILLRREHIPVGPDSEAEFVIWEVDPPVRGSAHHFKYRFALMIEDVCVLRYDNEAGKGDHRHIGTRQFTYRFVDLAELEIDFWKDAEEWLTRRK